MDLTLFVGDYAYSSWSLRGWLLLDGFDLPFKHRYGHMRSPAFEALRVEMAPSEKVPALRVSADGAKPYVVWDSLAMAETLAELFPDAGHWPSDPAARGRARSLTAEMHAGFTALRGACPMNMRRAYAGFEIDDDVRGDLDRLAKLWTDTLAESGGPFLFGSFTAADAFFAPVASRIATYGLDVGNGAGNYVAALLGYPSVRRWRAMGMADSFLQDHYELPLADRPNPHEPALTGLLAPGDKAENDACPYSGKPVEPDCVIAVGTRRIGYCNPFCAAKSAADPMAWPATAALLEGQSG